ncbi:hypothetical protein ILUMI_06147 [Ignelater luminosus]|uniref:Polyprenal reductase n=1 Tax=Ignelater luminosus TaxID=2038154 RepID=A0A8K0GJE4_IGNLU|nr:hypothetical protein ILUMI_06147 [Ignelater luminosus]
MSEVNYIKIIFSFMTFSIILMGSLINSFEKYLPVFLKQCFRYGKFAYKGKTTRLKPVEVPKAWFRHFYVYSSILTIATLILAIAVLIFNVSVPRKILNILDAAGGTNRKATVTSVSALLALTLLTIQCCRRMYDTHFVSVFGKTSRMNLSHYLIGFIHYTGAVFAILVEAPRFSRSYGVVFRWIDLTYIDVVAALFFLWANWHQYKATVILANLRKDKKGSIITDVHKLPCGDWFEYVSSPHLLAEILMYFALTVILRNNVTWLYIFAWVLSNQVETALLSHWWYKETFSDFPKQRRAIIPFIY